MATTPIAAGSRCYLLELAPELRNHIYGYVFSHNKSSVPLKWMRHRGPQKNLLVTCKLINAEAGAMYKSAFRRYVSTTKFTAYGENTGARFVRSEACLEEDVAHISKLHVRACFNIDEGPLGFMPGELPQGYELQWENWHCCIKYFSDWEILIVKQNPRKDTASLGLGVRPAGLMSKRWLLDFLDRCSDLGHDDKLFDRKTNGKENLIIVDEDAGTGNRRGHRAV